MLLSIFFYNTEKRFFVEVLYRAVLWISKIALRLRDFKQFFVWKSLEILNVFNVSFSKQVFWKKPFFKARVPLSVASAMIESTKFPYKIALSKQIEVKTNWMGSIKWTYHKEQSFSTNYSILLKIYFLYKNLL